MRYENPGQRGSQPRQPVLAAGKESFVFSRLLAFAAIAFGAVAVISCASKGPPGASSQPISGAERGAALVRAECARCHGVALGDSSPLPEAIPLRDLSRFYEPENLAEALAEGIVTGHPAMPQFEFDEPDVRAIIAYLNTIQSRRTPSAQ